MTCTLLSPRLSAATADFGACLSLLCALAVVGQLLLYCHVNQVLIYLYTETSIGKIDFVNFLADKNYDYKLESEKLITDLEAAVKKDKYDERIGDELESLRAKLAHDKSKDLQIFKSEISSLLQEEIVSRYYYQVGRVKSQMSNDSTLFKAIGILSDAEAYAKLLQLKE